MTAVVTPARHDCRMTDPDRTSERTAPSGSESPAGYAAGWLTFPAAPDEPLVTLHEDGAVRLAIGVRTRRIYKRIGKEWFRLAFVETARPDSA
jgi:hypothetical protein